MKIIHCADLHLDSPLNSNFDFEKAKIRQNEILISFEGLVNYASNEKVEIVIIAGDLFDNSQTTSSVENFVVDTINKASNISFIYLLGNHDENFVFKQEIPKNLFLVDDKDFNFETEEVCIKALTLKNQNYDNISFSSDKFNILVAHGSHNNASDEYYINLNLLKNKSIDYLALGHIHKSEIGSLDERGVFAQSGCLDGRGFDECGAKGFMLIDTIEKHVEFIENSSRIIYEKDVDISDANSTLNAIEMIETALADIQEKSIVRVNLTGEIDSDLLLSDELIISHFKDKFFAFSLKNKTKVFVDYNIYENDISLKGEFIRICKKSDMTEEKRSKVITTVFKALESRELDI